MFDPPFKFTAFLLIRNLFPFSKREVAFPGGGLNPKGAK